MIIKIVSWNIQMAKGVDNSIDLTRIIEHLRKFDADIICLQEIGRNLPELQKTDTPDQKIALSLAFKEYLPIWASGLSWHLPNLVNPSRRREDNRLEFGNLTLVRNEVLDKRIHALPLIDLREDDEISTNNNLEKTMPRAVAEITIPVIGAKGKTEFVRILNLHLAYHNKNESLEQFKFLNTWQNYNIKLCKNQVKKGDSIFSNPYLTARSIMCGDFNMPSDSKRYDCMLERGWQDAWTSLHQNQPRVPTCGVYDTKQWQEGAHTRDYFMYQNITPVAMEVDSQVDYSDHQPIVLEFKL